MMKTKHYIKKLIKNISKHKGTNRKQFLFLNRYNLGELEDISFKARKLVKGNKIRQLSTPPNYKSKVA